jgi:hypothetical protein
MSRWPGALRAVTLCIQASIVYILIQRAAGSTPHGIPMVKHSRDFALARDGSLESWHTFVLSYSTLIFSRPSGDISPKRGVRGSSPDEDSAAAGLGQLLKTH